MSRVMIVDDEQVVAETLRLIFEQRGFATCTAHSTDEAMACARACPPDLLLCDIDMPGRDGVELISEIEGAYPKCQIMVLTGAYASIARVEERESTTHRPLTVLAKPCSPTELFGRRMRCFCRPERGREGRGAGVDSALCRRMRRVL